MSGPLVTIVTPIHEGADHVAACVESVRAQDHRNWIHLLVDNHSRDGTGKLIRDLAATDPRIRPVVFEDQVGMLANWNRALSLVPADTTYVHQLNVDDRLVPRCLTTMVAAAERNPEVAIISSFFRSGRRRLPRVKHARETRINGREVVRELFLGRSDYLAQPSVLLLRRKSIRGWPEIYRTPGFPPASGDGPPLPQADKEGFLKTLLESDLLFVPEELAHLRHDRNSASGHSERVGAWHAGWMELLMRHGSDFLEPDEIARAMRRLTLKYIRSSSWRTLKGRGWIDAEFTDFRRASLAHLVPTLREHGFEREARMLARFARLVGVPT